LLTLKGKNPNPNLSGRPNEQIMLNEDCILLIIPREKQNAGRSECEMRFLFKILLCIRVKEF
jgi:hypothetical protein